MKEWIKMEPKRTVKLRDIVYFQNLHGGINRGRICDIGDDGHISVENSEGKYGFPDSSYVFTRSSNIPGDEDSNEEKYPEKDPTNPSYYKSGKYEIFDVLMDWIRAEKLDGQEAALIFNAVKYLRRFKSKHPDNPDVDLKKAKWYLEKLIEYEKP